jgi:hypothetical protein
MALDLTKFAMVLDVWDGSGNMNEGILQSNGVEALMIRMNTTWGGLQYDDNFLTQWKEAANFKRGAYVVVSPVNIGHDFTAKEVVEWVLNWKPVECKVIGIDVEIDTAKLYNRPDITPLYYHNFLNGIIAGLQAAGMTVLQYSGANYIRLAQPWITDVTQWWARYMINGPTTKDANGNIIYPTITWPALKAKMAAMDWTPLVPSLTEAQTGRIQMWQVCSSWVLPGCPWNCPVDINLIRRDDFERIFGAGGVVIPPVGVTPLTDAQILDGIHKKLIADWRVANPGK